MVCVCGGGEASNSPRIGEWLLMVSNSPRTHGKRKTYSGAKHWITSDYLYLEYNVQGIVPFFEAL